MAALRPWRATGRAFLQRCLPTTLRGRLILLLFVAVLASHVLALAVVLEFAPRAGIAQDLTAADVPPHRQDGFWHSPVPLLDIGVRLLALMLAAWWGARWLAAPLRRLARAARELSADIHRPPLSEDGTLECREASRVFNQMQARIRQQLADRDRFVAAVSHDLRTPLTRLRLRAEGLQDETERQRFSRDIHEMDAMLTATLDHLRGVACAEPRELLDIQALLESLVDDEQACGHDVTLSGAASPLSAQAGALRRCVGNLVGNALRYAGSAEITLSDGEDAVRISVRDHGPGLPVPELDKVLQPFYRGKNPRRDPQGGMGLGLAIVHDIVQRHHGRLELANAPDGGLVATVTLPRAAMLAQPG